MTEKTKFEVIEGGKRLGRCPAPPAWLTEAAKVEWKRVAPRLHEKGLLTTDTLATLESYCVSAGQVRECEKLMATGRLVGTGEDARPHAAFKIQSAAMREARLLAAALGLTRHCKTAGTDEGKGDGWEDGLLA